MKKTDSDLIFVHKIEFLMQSVVIKMDDELIGAVTRFAERIASFPGVNFTGVHQVFEHA